MNHLGYEDGATFGLAGGEQIVGAPRGLERVDTRMTISRPP